MSVNRAAFEYARLLRRPEFRQVCRRLRLSEATPVYVVEHDAPVGDVLAKLLHQYYSEGPIKVVAVQSATNPSDFTFIDIKRIVEIGPAS